MLTVGLFDSEFPGQPCSVNGRTPRQVEYVRDRLEFDGITVFTDRRIYSGEVAIVQSRVKVAWLLEGRCLRPGYYEHIHEVEHLFDLVLTTDPELLARGGKYRQVIRGGAWLPAEKWHLYPKSKNVSLLLSDKRETEGHKLRHEIAEQYGGFIDVYRNVPKEQALLDYRFSIIVEACYAPNWFSEHLLDCIGYGTIPLYCGCPNLHEFLPSRSVIAFTDATDLRRWLDWADTPYVAKEYDFLRQMLLRPAQIAAEAYELPDDWVAEHVYLPMLAVQP